MQSSRGGPHNKHYDDDSDEGQRNQGLTGTLCYKQLRVHLTVKLLSSSLFGQFSVSVRRCHAPMRCVCVGVCLKRPTS